MAIDPSVVDHVARLARLELTADERARLARQLSHILEYFARLDRLDTEGVEPTSHVVEMSNVFRDDVPGTPLPREVVLASAPEHEDGFFKVPPILEWEPQP
ncbi:MAG: Asp-tRNA(Asn)/Glu-tRNA(Gln) amidotransferase subunit GatC [Armatimonadota bacterium]|nr:Asp-tRNA(Asn)/Glu-tRNA(Gln) amidotransferase subunit GatC [Armatimonadota bacterium]MDR7401440.1 Asp-tRNA(Asn)/Glu-tRNA(Gln) amidotransferase subunit GatC [Armatimonadota bacterium]MDR7404864.1 Asp-tRNA(Asn)/Glu-tRNA(Gln) amidotransferase subunit GatC [Armatimonadota bacterium]MDR7437224.1 Asp-tRNA(Asn)/Glu-tRNA(Gln) amidotransferase subunit GatC [Armatimonadota bacterium]MDR7473024.1 Asp-tRNA(Asn)/Glu-tRNA(Gln) amidotransferase subunit GatC [Armatimonadota bacterium]